MIFKNETLNKAIRDLITAANTVTPILAIRAEQNGPIPTNKPFATVRIALRPPIGWAEKSLVNNISGEDIDETVAQKTMVRASVNYFKNSVSSYSDSGIVSAIDEALNLKLFLQGTLASQTLDAAGIGLNRISEVRNLSALEESEWEERSQLDIDFNVIASRTDLIMEIKSVLVEGNYQEHNNEYLVSATIDADTTTLT